MATLPNRYVTAQEYLAFDRDSPIKHEYFAGEIYAMGGASLEHNLIVINIGGELRQQLKGRPCRTLPSDMRVLIESTGLYVYPDVSVVCGEPEFGDGRFDVLVNPTIVVEVLSESTKRYDRGTKLKHYQQIPSLTNILLVAQDRVQAELYWRNAEGAWKKSTVNHLEGSIELAAIGCRLPLAEVYDKVDLT